MFRRIKSHQMLYLPIEPLKASKKCFITLNSVPFNFLTLTEKNLNIKEYLNRQSKTANDVVEILS